MKTSEILARLKESRVLTVEVGHITFTGECPLYAKLMGIINACARTKDSSDAEMAALAVNHWEGVTEADIFPDGDPDKLVPFDRELFDELIRDRADWWKPISMKLTEIVQARQVVKEAEIKNSPAGTTQKRSKDSKTPKE